MSAEKGSSKADTLVKVVLVFFISLLSFSVGTFVGKQVSDSDHRRMALEGEGAGRDVASAGEHGDEEKISDKEVENLTEEFVNKEKGERAPASADDHHEAAADSHGEAKHEPDGYKAVPRATKPAHGKESEAAEHAAPASAPKKTPEHHEATDEHAKPKAAPAPKAAKPVADAAHDAADKVAHGEAPTDGEKEVRKPAAALPAVASSAIGKYTVQVASYATEDEAKSHAATLKGKGWSAFYVPANVQGRTWYRVSVGIFDSNKAAGEFRAQFLKDSNSKTALVQKIVQ